MAIGSKKAASGFGDLIFRYFYFANGKYVKISDQCGYVKTLGLNATLYSLLFAFSISVSVRIIFKYRITLRLS